MGAFAQDMIAVSGGPVVRSRTPVLDWRSHALRDERGPVVPYVEGQPSHYETLLGYGMWIADLAPWGEFVTLTHRPRWKNDSYNRMGVNRHRRMVRDWFYGEGAFRGRGVRDIDPSARWWSETELHATGIPHEHGLLKTFVDATDKVMMRDEWRRVCGDYVKQQGARFDTIREGVGAAAYVAKYTEKSAAKQPRIFGFGHDSDLVSESVMAIAAGRVFGPVPTVAAGAVAQPRAGGAAAIVGAGAGVLGGPGRS